MSWFLKEPLWPLQREL